MAQQAIIPSHVAVLVPSVHKAADYLSQFDLQIGAAEIWDGEGTKEIYVEKEKSNCLLLMEPIKEGAYQRAMEKRGPGLHHLAIDVLNLESYIESLAGSGWLLHPISLKTIKRSQTAYLARPGFPGLIEVQGREELHERPYCVTRISLNMPASLGGLLRPVGLDSLVMALSRPTELTVGGHVIVLGDLF